MTNQVVDCVNSVKGDTHVYDVVCGKINSKI